MLKKVFAITLSFILLLSMTACGEKEATNEVKVSEEPNLANEANGSETFKIGISTSVTGAGAVYGLEAINGAELAVAYINANGGFNGVPAEITYYDEQNAPEELVKIAQKFIQTDHVNVVIASNSSSNAMASCPYYNEAGILTFVMGNSPALTEQGWECVYRAVMNNAYSTPVIAKSLVDMGFKNVALAKSQDENGLATAVSLLEEMEAADLNVLTEESFEMTDTDFSGQCARIVAANPECVFLSTSGDATPNFVKQLRGNGYDGIIFTKDAFTGTMMNIAGEENSNYIIYATPYITYDSIDDCDIPEVKEFLEAYSEAYDSLNTTEVAYRPYDSIMSVWEASKIAGTNDSAALIEAMDQVKDIKGLGGTIDFTAGDHEAYHSFNSFVVVEKKNHTLSNWLENGGYEAYKAETGNEY